MAANPETKSWPVAPPRIPDTSPRDPDKPDPILDRAIDAHYENARLSEVLRDLRERTGLHGAYVRHAEFSAPVTLDAKGVTVRDLLKRIAKAVAASDPDVSVRAAALRARALIGGEKAYDLIHGYADEAALASKAVHLLGRPGDERHLDRFAKWLYKESTADSAAYSLGVIGTDRARMILEQAVRRVDTPTEVLMDRMRVETQGAVASVDFDYVDADAVPGPMSELLQKGWPVGPLSLRPRPPELRFDEHEFDPWIHENGPPEVAGWPFGAAEAERRQRQAAKKWGVPVEKTVSLDDGTVIEFVLIPPGSFVMGATLPPVPPPPPDSFLFGLVARGGATPELRGQGGEASRNLFGALRIYASGRKAAFHVELDLNVGTEFQQEVWGALRSIPYGEVRTYKQTAESLGRPKAARFDWRQLG